jgi:hypothetical protein
MRQKAFPADAIEATSARIKYGLNVKTYGMLAGQLPAWRLGSAVYHSDGELRRLIRKLVQFEPAGEQEATA